MLGILISDGYLSRQLYNWWPISV